MSKLEISTAGGRRRPGHAAEEATGGVRRPGSGAGHQRRGWAGPAAPQGAQHLREEAAQEAARARPLPGQGGPGGQGGLEAEVGSVYSTFK